MEAEGEAPGPQPQVKDVHKKLFTPGPLGVSPSVRAALNRDLGSRDSEFIQIIKSVRDELVRIAGLPSEKYTTILMQGSGTFAVEATLQSTSDRTKQVLILSCGAYGRRMEEICSRAKIPYVIQEFAENEPVEMQKAEQLISSQQWGSVAVVHCETTSGVLNKIHDIGMLVKSHCPQAWYIVDAMSSFGGVDSNFSTVDFLISSANKCLQGVPGIAYVIADKEKLQHCQGRSMSLALDLYQQWEGLESNGQFRFTPPTHVILGLHQALKELDMEGGISARACRYKENNTIIKKHLRSMGFITFVQQEHDGHIITSFKYPNHPNFNFTDFYNKLSNKGQLIYPGKVTNANCFRIGNIGHLFPQDMEHLVNCIHQVLQEMKVPIPVSC